MSNVQRDAFFGGEAVTVRGLYFVLSVHLCSVVIGLPLTSAYKACWQTKLIINHQILPA